MSLQRKGSKVRWSIIGLALLVLLAAGQAARMSAQAGVRRAAPPKEHFKSGAQRSEALLSEILSTLQRMDERISRIEKNTETSAAVRRGILGGTKRQR